MNAPTTATLPSPLRVLLRAALCAVLFSGRAGLAHAAQGDGAAPADADGGGPLVVAAAPAAPLAAVSGAGSLRLTLRSFAERLDLDQLGRHHAWVQAAQLEYVSPWTSGPVQFGMSASAYAALTLAHDDTPTNLWYAGPAGAGRRHGWAYPGLYAAKVKLGETVVQAGALPVANPIVEFKDNRALPSSFRGALITSTSIAGLQLEAGSVDRVYARGTSYLAPLSTGYSGSALRRVDFAGALWQADPTTTLTVYAGRLLPLWDRYFAAVKKTYGDASDVEWTGEANLYVTRARRASPIQAGGKSHSLALTGRHQQHSLTLACQTIASDQVFDFLAETTGFYLSNAMATDYNAPHERSLQLRYLAAPGGLGPPGLTFMAWAVWGRLERQSAEAAKRSASDAPLHELYWKDGQPVHGKEREIGLSLGYVFQRGALKDAKVTFIAAGHKAGRHHPDIGFHETRLVFDMPLQLF